MSKKHNKKNNKVNNNPISNQEEIVKDEKIEEVVEEVADEVKEEVVEEVEEVKEEVAEEVKEEKEVVQEPIEEAEEQEDEVIKDFTEKKGKAKKNKGTKFSERVSVFFRKRMFVGTVQTWIIALLLIAIYVFITYAVENLKLPEIDITSNKLYSISNESAEAVKKIDKDITIYYFGFDEKSVVVDLLKKYTDINEKIAVTELTAESNYDLATEYGLIGDSATGFQLIIVVSGDQKRLVDSSDFYTYDYSTGQTIDKTEQMITNSLLLLAEGNQPKVYFVSGHEEFSFQNGLAYLNSLFEFEVLEAKTLNIANQGIPEDCDVLAFMSPRSDLLESEVQPIKDYINRGGEIYFGLDTVASNITLNNFQQILDLYGVTVRNGYITEQAEEFSLSGYPYIFNPQINIYDDVTKDLYASNKPLWLIYAQALSYVDDAKLSELNVTKTQLLYTSDKAMFNDGNPTENSKVAQLGTYDIAARMSKVIDPNKVDDTSDENVSNLIVCGTSTLVSDYVVEVINQSYPLGALGGNKDFVLNAFNTLSGTKNIVTIRKDMGSSTYTPTDRQNNIVLTIIFATPLIIIVSGFIIYIYRKKRK